MSAAVPRPDAGSLEGSPLSVALPILKADPIFDTVLRFNLFPAEYADASWIQAIDEVFDRMDLGKLTPGVFSMGSIHATAATPLWVRQMSLALLRRRELELQYDFDFSDTGKRLALLGRSALKRLGQRTAALLARPVFRKLIRGDDVAAVDAVVGRDLRLQALSQQMDIDHLAVGLESLLTLVKSAIRDPEAWAQMPLRIVISALPENAAGVRARVRFKFPREWRRVPRCKLDDSQRRQLVNICLIAGTGTDDDAHQFIWKSCVMPQGGGE